MQTQSIREYIEEAKRLLQSDQQLGDIATRKQEDVKEWSKKYHSCSKNLSSALTKAQKFKKDLAAISIAEQIIIKIRERENEFQKYYKNKIKQTNAHTTPTIPYVRMATLPPEDPKDTERDKLSEKIYNRLIPLRDNSLTQPRLKELREIENEWKELLETTTDISCRQIIKEGLNDCLSLRKQWGMEYDTKSPLPPKPNSKRLFLPTLSDVSSKGIYAQVSVVGCENRRFRNEDGDVMMFFGNGDVIVL